MLRNLRNLILVLAILTPTAGMAQGLQPVKPTNNGTTTLFPTPFVSANNIANVTATALHGLLFIHDGTNWDMWNGGVSQVGTWNIGALTSITNPVAVTGTFFQATQPISAATLPLPAGASTSALQDGIVRDGTGDLTQANVSTGRLHVDGSGVTQPVSGTVTVTDGAGALNVIVDSSALPTGASTLAEQQTQTTALQLIDNLPLAQGAATAGQNGVLAQGAVTTGAPTYVTGNSNPLSLTTAGGLRVDGSGVTQPVSGTVTVGVFPDNEPFNVAQINGVAPLMGNGITGTGSQRVTIASDNTAFTTNVGTFPDNEPFNVAQVAGVATVTAAAGVQRVGIAGSANGALDAANNAAAPANVLVAGVETATQTVTQPTASTTGNVRRPVAGTDGVLYARSGGPVQWQCNLAAVGTTLTQCQAAPGAGLRLYITDILAVSATTTTGLWTLRFGTGAACATGTGNLFFASAAATIPNLPNAAVAGPQMMRFVTPIAITANNALCVLGVVTNTTNIQISGYTAP